MCVACVYTLERFIKEYHKEELRKKEAAAAAATAEPENVETE
jgi:hypothetical protein